MFNWHASRVSPVHRWISLFCSICWAGFPAHWQEFDKFWIETFVIVQVPSNYCLCLAETCWIRTLLTKHFGINNTLSLRGVCHRNWDTEEFCSLGRMGFLVAPISPDCPPMKKREDVLQCGKGFNLLSIFHSRIVSSPAHIRIWICIYNYIFKLLSLYNVWALSNLHYFFVTAFLNLLPDSQRLNHKAQILRQVLNRTQISIQCLLFNHHFHILVFTASTSMFSTCSLFPTLRD